VALSNNLYSGRIIERTEVTVISSDTDEDYEDEELETGNTEENWEKFKNIENLKPTLDTKIRNVEIEQTSQAEKEFGKNKVLEKIERIITLKAQVNEKILIYNKLLSIMYILFIERKSLTPEKVGN